MSKNQPVGSRERILDLLCAGARTAAELADALGMTATGVRGHVSRLEAEGLVTHRVVRRGVGKPAHEYRLTSAGSLRLSGAYLPMLEGLLQAVLERSGPGEQEALLREVGRRLARQHPRPGGGLAERAEAGAALLRALGARCLARAEGDGARIEGACCPLRAVVPDHPVACKAVESMLEEYIGAPVREACDKHDPPACSMLIGAAAARPGGITRRGRGGDR